MRAHFQAVLDRLKSDTSLQVHDTANLNTEGLPVRDTYVVLMGGAPESLTREAVTRSADAASEAEYLYTVRCVSTAPDGVRADAQKVLDLLVGWLPAVEGRRCQKVELDFAGPVETDASVRPALFFMDIDVVLRSRRG